MPNKQLPAYFREYLDERFNHVLEKIIQGNNHINSDILELKDQVRSLNNNMSVLKHSVKKNDIKVRNDQKKIEENRKKITIGERCILSILIFMFIFGVIFLKDMDFSITSILVFLGSL